MVEETDGMRGTVISRASAEYRRIWEVALKSPKGSAVTIIVAFCGFRCVECGVWEEELADGKEFEKRSSVSLHWRKGTKFGFVLSVWDD
jgi:hypothetical protein